MSKAKRCFPLSFYLSFFQKLDNIILLYRFSYLDININVYFPQKLYLKSLEIFDPNIKVTIYYNKLSSRKNYGKPKIHKIQKNYVNPALYSNGVLLDLMRKKLCPRRFFCNAVESETLQVIRWSFPCT